MSDAGKLRRHAGAVHRRGLGAGRLRARRPGKGEGHTGRVSVIATNEPAALAEITNAITKQDGAIASLRVVNRQSDFFEAVVDVEVRDLGHLSRVIAGLRAASAVHQVERARG